MLDANDWEGRLSGLRLLLLYCTTQPSFAVVVGDDVWHLVQYLQ